MRWVHASCVATQMVYVMLLWNRPDKNFIGHAMRKFDSALEKETAIDTKHSCIPIPATIVGDNYFFHEAFFNFPGYLKPPFRITPTTANVAATVTIGSFHV